MKSEKIQVQSMSKVIAYIDKRFVVKRRLEIWNIVSGLDIQLEQSYYLIYNPAKKLVCCCKISKESYTVFLETTGDGLVVKASCTVAVSLVTWV